jgi:tetratricopeptide (TPR) repeat protein
LQSNNAAKSKLCFTEAVDLARLSNNRLILLRALANRGSNASFGDNQKEIDLNEALKLSRQLRDTVGEIEMLTRIYEIYFVKQRFDTVKTQLLHVTELEKLIGYKHIHYNYYVLSYLDFTAVDYVNAFSHAKLAIEVMEANRDFAFSNFFYGNMANLYGRFDNYEKAIEWLHKSLEQETANKAKRIWYHQFCNLTLNLAKFGHPQQALDAVLKTIRDYPPVSADNKFHVANVLGYSYYRMNRRDLAKSIIASCFPLWILYDKITRKTTNSIPHTSMLQTSIWISAGLIFQKNISKKANLMVIHPTYFVRANSIIFNIGSIRAMGIT